MAYPSPRQLQLRRGNTVTISSYTGPLGEVIINTDNWGLYIQDGVTAGGHLVSAGGSYGNTTVKNYLNNFDGNIIPSANVTYSLGNITHQWNDLYVSNNTIYVGGVPLSIDNTGNLTINGNTIPTVAYVNTAVANVVVDLSSYALNANVTAANVGMKGYVDQGNTIQAAAIVAANVGMKGYVDASIGNIAPVYGNANVASYLPTYSGSIGANISKAGYTWTFGTNGNITFPDATVQTTAANPSYINSVVSVQLPTLLSTYTGNITADNITITGNLVLTDGGNIIQQNFYGNTGQFYGDPTTGFGAFYAGKTGFTPLPQTIAQVSANYNSYAQVNLENTNAGNQATADYVVTADIGTDTTYYIDMGIAGSGYVGLLSNNSLGTSLFPNDAYLYTQGNTNVSVGGNLVIGTTTNSRTVKILSGGTNDEHIAVQINHPLSDRTLEVFGNIYSPTIDTINNDIAAANAAWAFANTIQSQQIAAANIGIIGYIDQGNTIQAAAITAANVGLKGYVDFANTVMKAYVDGQIIAANANVSSSGGTNYSNVNVAAYLSTATINTTGNITAAYISGNISVTGNVTGTSPNVTIQAGAYNSVFDNQGNVTVPKLFSTGNIQTAGYLFGNGAFLTGVVTSGGNGTNYSNVNVQAYTETMGFKNYSNVNVAAYLNTTGYNLYSNVNVAVYLAGSVGDIIPTSAYSNNLGNAAKPWGNFVTYNLELAGGYLKTGGTGGISGQVLKSTGSSNPPAWSNIADVISGSGAQITVANLKLSASGNIVFADGTVQTTAASGGSNYGNGNVASYLITNGYVNTNSAYANANVTSYLPTHTGNVGVSNLLGTTPNVTLVANSYSTTYDIYGNVAFGNAAYPVQIFTTGNISTAGYLIGTQLRVTDTRDNAFTTNNSLYVSGGATVNGNIAGGGRIVACSFASSDNINSGAIQTNGGIGAWGNLNLGGQAVVAGNVTVNGMAGITMPNRPAFRVNGSAGPTQTTSNVNLKSPQTTVIFNQGSYYNDTTGKFTAPVAGIYQVSLTARVTVNSSSQIAVLKNGLNNSGNVVCFWEADTNTGTATHFGVNGTIQLAVGDYLSANILLGSVNFDGNDNWCVTYLG